MSVLANGSGRSGADVRRNAEHQSSEGHGVRNHSLNGTTISAQYASNNWTFFNGQASWYFLATLRHSLATAPGSGPRRVTRRPFFMWASSPMIGSASSNRSSLLCAAWASLGTISLRNRSTDSMLSGSFLLWGSASRINYFIAGDCMFQERT